MAILSFLQVTGNIAVTFLRSPSTWTSTGREFVARSVGAGMCLGCKHSHAAVRLLFKAFVGRHAQRHLTDLAAEAALVPVLGGGREPNW